MDIKAKIISRAGKIPGVGEFLRKIARGCEEGTIVKIGAGEAKGLLWQRSHQYVNGYWLGIYELELQACIARELKSGNIFFDIGANAGFFSLIGARKVGEKGKVIAFEPLAENVETIMVQSKLNDFSNRIIVEQVALSDQEGSAKFLLHSNNSMGKLIDEGEAGSQAIMVPISTLDRMAEKYGIPDFVKIDVEGNESRVLEGAKHVLKAGKTVFLIELHNQEQVQEVRKLLNIAGYDNFYYPDGEKITGNALPRYVLVKK